MLFRSDLVAHPIVLAGLVGIGLFSALPTPAHASDATSANDLDIEDARDLSAMMETHYRLVEKAQLEAKVAALEKAGGCDFSPSSPAASAR